MAGNGNRAGSAKSKEEKALLAIDIGNSSINMGIFGGKRLLAKFNIPTHPEKTGVFYKKKILSFLSKNGIATPLGGVILSSVVPERSKIVRSAAKELSVRKPVSATFSMGTGLSFDIKRPDELGADRIANVTAAFEIFGVPVVVVDFGTATTVSAVKDGRFLGGAILPGLRLMDEALYRGASKLPLVDIGSLKAGEIAVPAMGKNTTGCIISGIIYGTAGAVERLIQEMETAEGCRFKVVITGGYAGTMAHFLKRRCYLDPDLTLKGLRFLYERNVECMS